MSSATGSSSKRYDLCILGATGYTGKIIVEYMLFHSIGDVHFGDRAVNLLSSTTLSQEKQGNDKNSQSSKNDTKQSTTPRKKIRLAVAARDHLKLLTMVTKFRLKAESMKKRGNDASIPSVIRDLYEDVDDEIGMFTVDLFDQESIRTMVLESKCVLSCSGPYQEMGEPLIQACVEHGTDYLDLTGEAVWMLDMIGKYQEKAKANKVLLVPASGMDSVPSDLIAWVAYQSIPNALRNKSHVRLLSCADLLSTKNNSMFDLMFGLPVSSGTFRTLLNLIADGVFNKRIDKSSDTQRIGSKNVHSAHGMWLVPNEVLPDGMVIRRSMELLLNNSEGFAPSSYEGYYCIIAPNKFLALATDFFMSYFLPLLRWLPGFIPFLKWAIGNNQGPSESFRSKSLVKLVGIAEAYDESSMQKIYTSRAILNSSLNPYEITAIVVSEVAKLMVTKRDELPGSTKMGYGFLTPVTCCGGASLVEKCTTAFTVSQSAL